MTIAPDDLFVLTLNELASLTNSHSIGSSLRSAFLMRKLLLDGNPLLHQANKTKRHKIRFTVSSRPNADSYDHIPIPDPLVHIQTLDPSVTPSQIQNVTLQRFLGLPAAKVQSRILTVRDIISLAANEGGGVHLSQSPSQELQIISSKMPLVGPILPKIISTLAQITCHALGPLRQEIIGSPPKDHILCWYQAPFTGSLHFAAQHWMHTDNMNSPDLQSLHFCALMQVDHHRNPRERVIYEIGSNQANATRLRLGLSPKRTLSWSLRRAGRRYLQLLSPHRVSGQDYHIIHATASLSDGVARLRMFDGTQALGSACKRTQLSVIPIHRQVIGADWNGNNGAAFQVKSILAYKRPLDNDGREALSRFLYLTYFW